MNMNRLFARPPITDRIEATSENLIVCFDIETVRRIRSYDLNEIRKEWQLAEEKQLADELDSE